MPSGRKGYGEELQIKQRYADLSEKAFAVLSEMLDSNDKNDKKWAVEQLGKGLVKMVPQVVAGDKENPLYFTPIYAGRSIQGHLSDQADIQPQEKD